MIIEDLHEIGVRKAHETRLAQTEARYRGLLEAAPGAMVVVNLRGEIVLLNVQAEKEFGYLRNELLGQQIKNIIPNGFAERLIADGRRSAEDALAQQIGTGIELIGRRKDGGEFPIELMLSPLESPEGTLVTAAIRNVSARRREETRLAQTEARYRGLLEAAPDAMVVVNLRGEIVLLNVQAEKQFGYLRNELLGQQIKNIIPNGFAERLIADGRRSAEDALAQQIGTGIELIGRRKDGGEFPIELMLSPLESPEGTLVTAAIRNVSARRRIEQELQQAQKMEALGNLTGGMAHDFNNLLSVVIGNLDLLRELRKDDSDVAELTQDALDAALRGAELTRALLAFARRQPLQPRRIDVNELVSRVIQLLTRTLGGNVQVSLGLAADLWPIVADPSQLETTLINLANNSRDAMPNGGQLKIVTANRRFDADYVALHDEVSVGHYVLIEVSDSGTGMTPEVASRVFEPFYTTKEQGHGTGLGLSMVFGFVKQSAGHINVYSEPGVGTTFRIYLPRMVEEVTTANEASLVPDIVHGGGEIVLVVEDNAPLRRVVVRQLGELGYRVIAAENAAAALELMKQENVDLLLTDIVMPGGTDGVELARQARQSRPALKVVYTSGFAESQIIGTARSLPPAARLLSKPYRKEELAAIVRAEFDS